MSKKHPSRNTERAETASRSPRRAVCGGYQDSESHPAAN
jgi:hypothetical protein